MNESEYLTPAEVRQLTGTAWKARQRKGLEAMGYPYENGPHGEPLVSRWFARNKACGVDVTAPSGPNLALVR